MENSERDGNTRPPQLPPVRQVKKQQLEADIEQQIGSKLGKEYVKALYCHPAYLTYMQSTSWEMPGWMKHKLESRLLGEISVTSDIQMVGIFLKHSAKMGIAPGGKNGSEHIHICPFSSFSCFI